MSITEGLYLELLRGRLTNGLEYRSNVVRLFISSGYSDMNIERVALLEKVYPELQAFCQKLGLLFEVVDLRWGMYDSAGMDYMTTDLCLEEIRSCKKVSAGPSIAVLLGNCYGPRPIPRHIPENEFELLLAKLTTNEEGVSLLNQWFWKDENSVPPTYVLQPISTHLPYYLHTQSEVSQLHDSAVATWQLTEARISQLLRAAAIQATNDGELSPEQKHKFFKSVSEWEIEQGLLGSKKRDQCALLFVRELARLKKSEHQGSASRFIDVTTDGLVDAEAQDLLSALKQRIYAACSGFLNLHCVELSRSKINPSCKEHAQYLKSLGEQFVSQMKLKIRRALALRNDMPEQEWCWLLQEITHHLELGAAKCAVFCGRDGLLSSLCLSMWESSGTSHRPLVVHGPSGVGKTAMMCRLAQEMRGVLGPKAVVVLRLLGTSPLSSEISSVLRSVCLQICRACSLPMPDSVTTSSHEELIRFFHIILSKVSQKKETLLIILDSLEQLSKANHAHQLYWLPKEIPPNVHLVVSTLNNEQLILSNLEGVIEQENFFEVEQLTFDQAKEMISAYMSAVKRCLTPEQHNMVLNILHESGNPLLLKLALSTARHWASYTPVSELQLGSSMQEATSMLFRGLENKHGRLFVGNALGYIVSARDGVTEAELRDLLSLDDEVLGEVYQHKLPPSHAVVHFPPLLWARLRQDLGEHLLEKEADGVKLLGLCNRQLTDMIQEMYLSAEHKVQRHRTLADYFMDHWSQGKCKPLTLHSLQAKLNPDRKVSAQPLWFTDGVANKRKLWELPYHLVHACCWEELQQKVTGSTEWLWCKTVTCGVASVIEDLSLYLEAHSCPETQLIRDTFLLMKPTFDGIEGQMDPSIFYTEIFARLYNLAETYPSLIGRLCSQCQDWFTSCTNPVLIPSCGFFQSPGGPLKKTLTGLQKGITVMDICQEKNVLVVGSEDGNVIVWNLEDLEVVHTLTGHTAGVRCVRIVNTGTRCLSLACDGTLRLWSLLSGALIHCIQEEFSPSCQPLSQVLVIEGMSIFCCSDATQVKAWHLETAELLFEVAATEGQVAMLGVLDEALAVLSDTGVLTLYDTITGVEKTQACLTASNDFLSLACIEVLQTRGKLAVGTKDGTLYLVSNEGTEVVAKLSSPLLFLIASDNEKLLCAGFNRQVAVFHVQASSALRFLAHAFQHEDTVLTAAISNQHRVLITGAEDHVIRVWCLSTGDLLDSFVDMGAPVTHLEVHKDTVIAASSSTRHLKLWQLEYDRKHKANKCFPTSSPLMALSQNGDKVYFLKHGDRTEVVVWDSKTGSSAETISVSAEVSCLELAQKKKLLFCGVKTGTILIYLLAYTPETLCIPPPETLPVVCCMTVSPAEHRLAVVYQDGICMFEITERDSFPSIEGPFQKLPVSLLRSPISSIALLSDCRLLKGTDSGEVMLYDFKNTSVTPLERHHSKITCITLSHNGLLALIGSQDSVQRLWSLCPLKLNYTMEYQGFFLEGVLCSAFSENDQYIYTGSQDQTIKVWDVVSGGLLAVQYVYAPVTKILGYRDGFVALSQLGHVIKERFHCPGQVSLRYNPLQGMQAHYRITSREEECDTPPPFARATAPLIKTKSVHACGLL